MIPPFVDAHHHLWDLERNPHAWLQQDPHLVLVCGSVARISRNYTPADFAADVRDLPLVGAVVVEAGWDGPPSDEVEWWESLPARTPTALVARTALNDPDATALLEALSANPRVAGIRDIVAWHPHRQLRQVETPNLLEQPTWRRNLARACRLGLVFDLQIYHTQVEQAVRLVRELPDNVTIVVEHSLMPAEPGPAARAAWRAGLRQLAEVEQFVLKISGLGMCLHHATEAAWREHMLDMLEAFGPERCMLGSNFPVDSMFVTYAELWGRFDRVTAELTVGERKVLFRARAEACYGLQPPQGKP